VRELSRPSWDEWAMGIVRAIATRGDCTRRQVGALILGPDRRILGCGYNGSYPGGPSCLAGDCPRGRHYPRPATVEDAAHPSADGYIFEGEVRCACGNAWPCPDAVAPGSAYDTGPGACIASHAEANAVADAQRRGAGTIADAVMYVSCEPCEGCVRHIRNTTQIAAIRWPDGAIGLP
jgi:dCMP deaminase